MPRKPRTLSGETGQGAVMPVDSTYGEGEASLESQRRMPVPDRSDPTATGNPNGQGSTPGGGQEAMAAAIAAATQMAPPDDILSAPTARPGEDITAGMARSANPIGKRPVMNESLYELRALAQRFPYPDLLEFLARLELR